MGDRPQASDGGRSKLQETTPVEHFHGSHTPLENYRTQAWLGPASALEEILQRREDNMSGWASPPRHLSIC